MVLSGLDLNWYKTFYGDVRTAQYSRYKLVEVTWKKMLAAGVILGYGSGSAPPPGRV
jgi:hypothetical protein